MRRYFFTIFLFAAINLMAAEKQGNKPNVLFIAIDDYRDWMGALGINLSIKTPELDNLEKTHCIVREKADRNVANSSSWGMFYQI